MYREDIYRDQWLTSNFILQYHWWIKLKGYENKGNDQYVKEPLIDKSIPLDNTIGYVHRTVRRICMLILGCRGLIKRALLQPLKITLFYYITDSTLCQFEANPMFWLANRAIKMSPSCPLEIYRWDPVHDRKFLGVNLKKKFVVFVQCRW